MKKSYKGLLVITIPFVAGFLLGILAGGGLNKNKISAEQAEIRADDEIEAQIVEEVTSDDDDVDGTGAAAAREVIYYGPRLKYASLFADLNERHLEVAKRVGLKSVPESRSEVDTLAGLVRISDNGCYVVDELKYSMPFLTAAAADELNAIGEAFRDSLKSKRLLDYKLVVSSLLRTEEDVRKLRRSGNPNASDNSAHCYATTFDITYTRYWCEDESEAFMQPYELTKVLGEVLRDRKRAGKCLVKYERKEHCFHITACQ